MESRGKLLAKLGRIMCVENETVPKVSEMEHNLTKDDTIPPARCKSDLFRSNSNENVPSSDDDIVLPTSESDVKEDYIPNQNVSSDDVPPTSESDLFSSDGEEEYIPNLNDLSSDDDFILPQGKLTLGKVRHPHHLNTDVPQLDVCQAHNADMPTSSIEDEITVGTKRKKKIFQLPEKKSRKRQRKPETWKKNKEAINRQKGLAYTSQISKKVIESKKVNDGNLCNENCRYKCNTNFSLARREEILSNYYKLDENSKNVLLFKSIVPSTVDRVKAGATKHRSSSYKFYITCDGKSVRVCKKAFCSLFQVGIKKVDLLIKKIKSGISSPPLDRRGRHENRPHKLKIEVKNKIIEHIRSFPADSSHYSRNVNPHKKYLSPQLSLSKMHELYLMQCNIEDLPQHFKVKLCNYRNIFENEFNLSFRPPKSDTCSTCDAGNSNTEHEENYKFAFEMQKLDREEARANQNVCYITLDLQQTMPLPRLTTSKAFYLRQMWFYNLGVHIITDSKEKATFFTWTENLAGRGSSEIGSCLLSLAELDFLVQSKNHLVIWSDSCAGQNKNFLLVLIYQYLILKGVFKTIDHKFPEVGHSYLDSDRDFGKIEKILRKEENIYLPEQYRDIIARAGKKNTVVDMIAHFRNFEEFEKNLGLYHRKKDFLNEKVRFRDGIKWIRVEEFGCYYYKESYDPNMPFRKVNLLRHENQAQPNNITVPRYVNPRGSLTEEKINNLQAQMLFVKEQFRWFYEQVFQQQEGSISKKTKPSTRKKLKVIK